MVGTSRFAEYKPRTATLERMKARIAERTATLRARSTETMRGRTAMALFGVSKKVGMGFKNFMVALVVALLLLGALLWKKAK